MPELASRTGLAGRELDMVVVGGGITGCGIAREAALRGLRVALVEQNDFGSGTSSRSSRLIHGGVRYLEHGHLRLVFEASAERRRLLRAAPHLVRPLAFTWPVYSGARVPRWKLILGLALYDVLALFRNVARHRRLGVDALIGEQPSLRRDGLRGGAVYYDAATDDARLTLAVALDARDHGAVLRTHTRATGLLIRDGRVRGVEVRDELTGAVDALEASVVVNATGPWSDGFRELEGSSRSRVRGSKGVHIAIPVNRLGNRGALTLLSPVDGRVMFVLPAGAHTIIGTTDTFTSIAPDEVRASESDVEYLLAAGNSFFPESMLTRDDVVSAWAGVRPLIASGTDDAVSASREHVITVSPAGMVTITGGKLTTFRVMAAETVEASLDAIGRWARRSRSADTPLRWTGGSVDAVVQLATPTTGDATLAAHLVGTYGAQWEAAWKAIASVDRGTDRLVEGLEYRLGELRYACDHEMARTLGDLLIRRTHVAFETRDHGRSVARAMAPAVGSWIGWSPEETAMQIDRYDDEVDRMFRIDSD